MRTALAQRVVNESKTEALLQEDKLTGRFRVVIFKRPGYGECPDEWKEEMFSSFRRAKMCADRYPMPFMHIMIDGEVEDKRYPWNGWMPVKANGVLPREMDPHVYCRTR